MILFKNFEYVDIHINSRITKYAIVIFSLKMFEYESVVRYYIY